MCGIPDDIKGEVIIAFLVLREGTSFSEALKNEIISKVRSDVGAIATPQQIYFVSRLPKTRSGKIMRRLLKTIASNEKPGDISTLEDGAAVGEIQAAFDDIRNQIS